MMEQVRGLLGDFADFLLDNGLYLYWYGHLGGMLPQNILYLWGTMELGVGGLPLFRHELVLGDGWVNPRFLAHFLLSSTLGFHWWMYRIGLPSPSKGQIFHLGLNVRLK